MRRGAVGLNPEAFRFGAGALADLGAVAGVLGIERPLLITTRRGADSVGELPVAGVYDGVRPHVPVETVREAAALARSLDADGLVALGGGSAMDTAKAVTVEVLSERRLQTIAVPTTYAGAEYTPFFGLLLGPGRKGGGADERAVAEGFVYDPLLTLGLPRGETVGTAMNALAHCAEAYYAAGRNENGDRNADCGATAIGYALPLVVERPDWVYARARLLEGAMRAGRALADAGLAFGHALAQALGGRYGLPQGTMNALVLPAALRFNEPAAPEAIARLGRALGTDDPIGRVEELAALGEFGRLRDHDVPEAELPEVAQAAAARAGSKANPREVTPEAALEVLRGVW